MKQILTFLVVFASFYASSQIAAITTPDATVCACDNATLSSSSSTPGASPIVRTIWSLIGPPGFGTYADTTNVGTDLILPLCVPGTYDVSIINQHQNGTSSVAQAAAVITVVGKPTAGIGAIVNSCVVPFGITYSNTNPVPGVTAAWTFEGGNPATFNGNNPPLMNYGAAGDYDVTLIVTDVATGCTDTAFRTMNVSNFESDIILPTGPLCANAPLQFTDNSTVGANTWNWIFENGSPANSSAQNPVVSFPAGTHTISLQSGNTSIGCNGFVTMDITVLDLPTPSFTASPLLGCSPLPVTFVNTNVVAGATYVWNYGDNTPTFAGANSPIHVYNGNGTYTPILTMTAANGCSGSFSTPQIVLSSPVACFSQTENNTCEPKNVSFDPACSTAPGVIASYTWIFGDGTPNVVNANGAIINHDYLCGEWTPTLVIQMASGCIDTVVGTEIKVGTHKTPDFFVDHHNDCIKKPFIFTDITQINCPHEPADIIRTWLFNNVPGGADSIFTKIFPDTMQNIGPNLLPGTDVGLIVNFRGCIDTTLTVDSVYISAPISKFQLSSTKFCDLAFNPNPLTKQVTIDDMASIYGHKWLNNAAPLNPIILDSTVANQNFDDVVLTYKLIEGANETILLVEEGEPFLDDNLNKGANVDPANNSGSAETTVDGVTGEITFTFDHYGSYDIWQIIENRNSLGIPTGCIDSSMVHVDVSWVETDFVFDIDPDSVCINNEFDFTSTSGTHGIPNGAVLNPHGPLSYSFNMISGGPVTGSGLTANQSFSHTYFVPGEYDVVLTTTNAVGCSNTATNHITAFALPIANFTLDDVDGCIGIQYTSTATNNSSHPAGSFGAGGAQTANWASTDAFHWTISPNGGTVTNPTLSVFNPSPSAVINNNATTFSLFVVDGFGCQSAPFSLTANVNQPNAQIILPTSVCNGTSVDAIDNSSGQQPMQRFWFFNTGIDGTPDGTGPVLTNILTSSGLSQTYSYQLIVIDAGGCPDTSAVQTITVSKPVASFTNVKDGASVDQFGNFTCPPVAVDFTNTSQSVSGIVSTQWYFNSVTNIPFPGYAPFPTTTQTNPQGIQYLFAGIYDVALIIQDGTGCIDTLEVNDFLEIQGPSATPIITESATVCGQTFDFQLTNPSNVVSWSWNLGDASTVNSADEADNAFNHTYLGVQNYNTVLSIVDGTGCVVNYLDTVSISPNGVVANFTLDPAVANLGTVVTMNPAGSGSTGGNISTWDWTFGDGTDSTMLIGNPITHQYYVGGEVPITLLVTDDRGCTDDMTLILTVDVKFEMPNVFTGFGSDGPNADLLLFADVFKDFEILIVNRWGNVVYEGVRDPQKGRYLWNGIDQKSSKLCNDGTYFYKLKGVLKNDVEVNIHGFVTLIASVRP